MISQQQIDNWFIAHDATSDQLSKYLAIRRAGRILAMTIVANAPDSPEMMEAINRVREAVMIANMSIACYPEGFRQVNEAASA